MQLDLNLLTALDALLEEGSVTGAAARLHLTTPAMSRTLGRLRRATGDPVLVRSGRGMSPTPYAVQIRMQVHQLVQQAAQVLTPQRELDLARLERTFTLQCHDAVAAAAAPPLLAQVRAVAPGVTLRFLAEGPADTNDLRHGRVDLAVGSAAPPAPDVTSRQLGTDDLVVVLRAGHPLLRGELSAERFAAADHVLVSRRGRLSDPVDEALAAHGLHRRVVASAPDTTTALSVARTTDAVVVVARSACRALVDALGLRFRDVPLALDPVALVMTWHRRHDDDPAHRFLRSLVAHALQPSDDAEGDQESGRASEVPVDGRGRRHRGMRDPTSRTTTSEPAPSRS